MKREIDTSFFRNLGRKNMNFFEHQAWARHRTRLLIPTFLLALLAVVLFFHLAIMGTIFIFEHSEGRFEGPVLRAFFEHENAPGVFLGSLIGVCLVVGGGSLYRTTELLSQGGERIAELLGGREISPFAQKFEERQLMNIVEEMSIASGIMVPGVYVLDKEFRINAFSAGFGKDFSVIGVTAGAIDYLSRDELQAVIAHEFSHIHNGDTKLNSFMIGILFGLNVITQIGMLLITGHIKIRQANGDEEYEYIPQASAYDFRTWLVRVPTGLVFILIGLFGTLLASLIKAAVSRQREFLADALAVQFTRNPEALKSALVKIGCPKVGSLVYSSHALEASHIFFAGAFGTFSRFSLFASHPHLENRIERIDPKFDEKYPERLKKVRFYGKKAIDSTSVPSTGILEEIIRASRAGESSSPRYGRFIARSRAAITDGKLDPDALVKSRRTDFNNPSESPESDFSSGEEIFVPEILADVSGGDFSEPDPSVSRNTTSGLSIDDLFGFHDAPEKEETEKPENDFVPTEIKTALETPQKSCLVFLGLILDSDPDLKEETLEKIAEKLNKEDRDIIRGILDSIEPLKKRTKKSSNGFTGKYIALRNHVLVHGIANIRKLSKEEYIRFRETSMEIESLHSRIDLFRYAFYAILRYELDAKFSLLEPEKIPEKHHSLKALEDAIRLVISYLAYAGHEEMEEALHAFRSACKIFELEPEIAPIDKCTFRALDASLKRIRYATRPIREKCLRAFRICICADGKITPREEEIQLAAETMILGKK